ncbi:unnamed protein product, partial [Prorocentrum cordatum]
EISQASAVVMSYSLDFIKLALHRCLGLFMLIDMVRRSQAIGHAIFFLCLQLMQDMRLEDVLDQEGRQVLIEGADRMLKTPQEWGKVIETSPHVTPYFDEVLRADQIAYEGFVKDLYHAGIVEFSFEVEDHITPFFVDKKGVALRVAPQGQVLHGALSDVSNFFYWLVLPHGLRKYFGLPTVSVPVVPPYCDNLIVMGTDKDSVSNVKMLAVDQLRRAGFQVHEEVEVTTFFESLGYLVDGKRGGGVFPIPHRLEKAVAAFTHLRRRPRVTGWQISKALGYVAPIFLLTRSMFSLSNALHQFTHENWSRKRRLWHSAALECKWISVLLPLAWADLRMPWIPQVKATDASLSGYAVGKSLWNVSDVMEDLETVKPIVDRFEPSPYEPTFLFKEIPEVLLQDSMWKTSYAAPFVFKEGIGDLESRAAVSGVKRTLRRELVGSIGIKASNSSESHVETFLEANAVTERTHAMHVKRVADFESWADAGGLRLTSAKLVDCALVHYLNQMWIVGADIGEATGTYAAWVKLRPSFSKRGPDKLVRTMKALQGFNRLDPGRTRPPLPLALAALIAVELVGMNLVSMALAVMLLFSAYLRPIELLSLQVTDVLAPTKGSPCYAIHLRRAERGQPSKVGLYDETLLLDSSAPPFLGYLLDAHRGAAAGPALFDFENRSFNESFKTAARTAGLAALKPDLYQLRHGGPSHDILNRLRSKAEVKDRGRWRGDRSVRRYEAHGRLQLQEKLVSEATQSRAATRLVNLEAQLRPGPGPEKAMVGGQDLFGAIVNTSGDHMKQAGAVDHCSAITDDATAYGRRWGTDEPDEEREPRGDGTEEDSCEVVRAHWMPYTKALKERRLSEGDKDVLRAARLRLDMSTHAQWGKGTAMCGPRRWWHPDSQFKRAAPRPAPQAAQHPPQAARADAPAPQAAELAAQHAPQAAAQAAGQAAVQAEPRVRRWCRDNLQASAQAGSDADAGPGQGEPAQPRAPRACRATASAGSGPGARHEGESEEAVGIIAMRDRDRESHPGARLYKDVCMVTWLDGSMGFPSCSRQHDEDPLVTARRAWNTKVGIPLKFMEKMNEDAAVNNSGNLTKLLTYYIVDDAPSKESEGRAPWRSDCRDVREVCWLPIHDALALEPPMVSLVDRELLFQAAQKCDHPRVGPETQGHGADARRSK